jgi:hypothetical protein
MDHIFSLNKKRLGKIVFPLCWLLRTEELLINKKCKHKLLFHFAKQAVLLNRKKENPNRYCIQM